jgi:hypothetical protein
MNRSTSKSLRLGVAGVAILAVWQCGPSSAWAQTPSPPPPPAEAPAAPAAPTSPLTAPSMAGPLTLSTTPYNFNAAGLGTVYLSGVGSGLGLFQTDPTTVFFQGKFQHDNGSNFDLSNGQLILQKIDGWFQFYAQGGLYSLPALGTNYNVTQKAVTAYSTYFGAAPVVYGKIVPSDIFNVEFGKLPTLIGAEYAFTFQNMNIERGLLWNQEPIISQGIQANLTTGPVAWSLSFNDGFYSGDFNWLSGSATWTIDPANTLAVVGGGNLSNSNVNTFATPFFQNDSDIVNLIYTYNSAPWTITPYFQYTSVPKNVLLGATKGASTWGGAVLANYNIDDNWNLAGRVEYISSSGSATDGSPSLLYGPGSSAWSVTATPTWQNGIYFARLEGSYVGASSTSPGFAFGKSGSSTSQERLVLEAGILF